MTDLPHVAMLLSNGYEPDVRVQKEAHTLARAGYRVTVIAWDRGCGLPRHSLERAPDGLAAALVDLPGALPDPSPVSIVRVPVRAGYRTGRRLLARMPLFWWRAAGELRRLRPDVVHAHDLDTLLPAMLYARLAGIPVVYDAHEYYPGMVRDNVGAALSGMLDVLDLRLAARADAVLTIGERLAARYWALHGRVWIVHNSQPLPDPAFIAAERARMRQAFGVPDDGLLVVYVGYLTPDRVLLPLVRAASQIDNVWVVVGGTGPQLAQIQAAASPCPRVRLPGWVPPHDLLSVVAAGDVVYYGLNAENRNSDYFMPNLAFFALAAGRPLLTTPVGEIADVVRETGCGVVMETATPEAAEKALRRLCDSAYRATLANQARHTGQAQYHWLQAAGQLVDAYAWLVGPKK